MKVHKPKLCFAASSGGHLQELLTLRPLMERYDSFIVTEETGYQAGDGAVRCYYVPQVNRRDKGCFRKLLVNAVRSLKICLRERPDAVICTGALAAVPVCLLCKLMGKKLVYIESFAKVTAPSQTGKLLYRFADRFYIQWPELRAVYPKAVYQGGVF